MKVAIYARVSSDRQAEKELSIPAQVKAIQQYCQERGHIITHEFLEKGKSAKTDDREEFQKMIALAKRSNRPFDAILVHKFDRFSRKRDDHVIYKALLAQLGVKVISVTEQTEADSPQDKLLEGMLEVMSEFFNANLAVEVRKGMSQNAKQGYNNGGTPPYGYRTEHIAISNQKTKAVWVHGPREEVDIIRWIFNQYAHENMGYKKISSMLNEKGVPTQKGGQWSASTIRAIIFNESYIGRRCWNKQDYQTSGKKWRDRSEWIITENAHPAIITEELFNLCQDRAKEKQNGGGVTHHPFQLKPSSPFWLRSFFFCDKCGSKMLGHSTSTTRKYGGQRYYVCGGYMRKGKQFCEYTSWRKESIERIITSKLRTAALRLTLDNQLEQAILSYHQETNKQILSAISTLETEIEFLRKKTTGMQADINSGRAKPFYKDLLEEMKSELQAKETEHTEALRGYTPMVLDAGALQLIQHELKKLIELLDDEMPSVEQLNIMVSKYVQKLIVQRETKTVHLTFHIVHEGNTLYEKSIAADWDVSSRL